MIGFGLPTAGLLIVGVILLRFVRFSRTRRKP